MKVYLNVRINQTDGVRIFTVWPRPNRYLPGIEFHTGISENLAEAVHQLKESLPEIFPIDDEYSVLSKSLEYAVIRPFETLKSHSIKTFVLVYSDEKEIFQ